MDLELSDYRYYRFLTPDAYKTGRANQEIYDEKKCFVCRVLTSTDPEGCVTEYGYNDYSQIATLAVNGNTAAYEYDLAGNISAVTDAEGRRVTFAYDLSGNLTQITYPDGTTETTQYDLLGRVVLATPCTGLRHRPPQYALRCVKHGSLPYNHQSTGCHTRPVLFSCLKSFRIMCKKLFLVRYCY